MNLKIQVMLILLGVVIYFTCELPIRKHLCEKQNMTAVWYTEGCVIKGEK